MKTSRTILIAALSLVLTGCVSKKQYAELQTAHNALKDKYVALDKDYQDAKVQIATFTYDSKSLAARLAEEQQRKADGAKFCGCEACTAASELLGKFGRVEL